MPRFPLRIWEDCRICWEAKGYKLDSIIPELAGLGRFGRSKVAELMNTTEPVPPQVAARVWSLPLVPGASGTRFEIYMRGLEASMAVRSEVGDGAPPDDATSHKPREDPTPYARDGEGLAEMGSKLDAAHAKLDTVTSRLDTVHARLDTTGSKLDGIQSEVGGKLDTVVSTLRGELGTVEATLDHADAKLDLVEARLVHADVKRERDKEEIIRAVWGSGGLTTAALVVMAIMQCQSPWTAGSGAAPVVSAPAPAPVIVNIGPGAVREDAQLRQEHCTDDDPTPCLRVGVDGQQMGEKVPVDKPLPKQPLGGQKVPPCLSEASEEAIDGGCWQRTDRAPPCGKYLFRRGNKCYRPIAADAEKPVSETSRRRDQGLH